MTVAAAATTATELGSVLAANKGGEKTALIEIPSHKHGAAGSKERDVVKVALVVAFYIVTSITMIMVNKTILNKASTLPMTFLWGQLATAVAVLSLLGRLRILSLPPVTAEIGKQLKYLVVLNVAALTLNTLCLKNIDAALYQIARSLILPMTAILSLQMTGAAMSKRVGASCAIITAGFLIGVIGDKDRNKITGKHLPGANSSNGTVGVMFGVLSSLATAYHSFIIKNSFSKFPNNGAFDMVYYNNIFSSLLLFPVVLFEIPSLVHYVSFRPAQDSWRFLVGTLIGGVSGLLINLAGFLQIKVTSPLTHTVSSASRGVLQTIACRIVLNEPVTLHRCVGIAVTLTGSAMYSWFKSQEQQG